MYYFLTNFHKKYDNSYNKFTKYFKFLYLANYIKNFYRILHKYSRKDGSI